MGSNNSILEHMRASQSENNRAFAIFSVVPLTTLFLLPNLLDTNGLPKLLALSIGTLFCASQMHITFRMSFISILPILIFIVYVLSQIVLPNNLNKFLIGSYGRAGGILSLLLFNIIFLFLSMSKENLLFSFKKVLTFTYLSILSFGVLQYFDLLPYKVTTEFNALSLTLGNPNFASAFLGILISAHLVFIIFDRSARTWPSVLVGLIAISEIFLIKSLQGFLVILVSILFLMYFKYQKRFQSISVLNRVTSVLLSIVSFISILIFTPIGDWIYQNGSVHNRLAYWKLSIEIFRDHVLFGVGIDNLRSYTIQYRDLNMALQEGVFTIPDRSHNVFIDHFVNGGIIAGLIWLLFTFSISYLMIRIIGSEREFDKHMMMVSVIWIGYVVQSAISVDHLALTLLGYISAGLICSKWYSLSEPRIARGGRSNASIRFVTSFIAISCFVYTASFLPAERKAGQFFYGNKIEVTNEIADSSRIQAQTLEKVMVRLSQEKQFSLAEKLTDKMLTLSPNNHQAYYVKSVYQESIGNDIMGREWMMKAHKADKWNPVYLLSLAIYDYKLGDFASSKNYVYKTEQINPKQQGLDYVKQLLIGK